MYVSRPGHQAARKALNEALTSDRGATWSFRFALAACCALILFPAHVASLFLIAVTMLIVYVVASFVRWQKWRQCREYICAGDILFIDNDTLYAFYEAVMSLDEKTERPPTDTLVYELYLLQEMKYNLAAEVQRVSLEDFKSRFRMH